VNKLYSVLTFVLQIARQFRIEQMQSLLSASIQEEIKASARFTLFSDS